MPVSTALALVDTQHDVYTLRLTADSICIYAQPSLTGLVTPGSQNKTSVKPGCFLQAALPCLIMAKWNSRPSDAMTDVHTSTLELRGGTDAAMAPPVSYVDQILLPMLERLQGVKASIALQRRGFFPKVVMLLQSYLPAVQTCGDN